MTLSYPQIRSRPNDSLAAEHGHNVHRRHEVSDRLLQLAALQSDVVTREQAIGHGMSRHSISRPRLSVEWTMLDLTEVRDAGEVVELVTTSVQRRLTTVKRLRQDLDARARHRHRALLNDLLADVGAGAESPIELRYLRDVERPHGLPTGSRQHSRSGLPYMSDVDYEEFGLIVELDGRAGHEGVGRFRDMDRDNRHALVDATTLRFGHYDLASRRCAVAFQVYCALAVRGYVEVFLRCRNCISVSDHDLLLA